MIAHHRRWARVSLLSALALVTLVTLAVPGAVTAHAELTSSDPANGTSVTGPLAGPIVVQFSEALQSGSHAELLDPGGAKVADAAIDASNRARMIFSLAAPLQPGRYTVQWTSVAADKDVARGQVTFTIVAPMPAPATATPIPPTQAPAVAPSAAPTAAPTATAPVPATSPAATASPAPPGPGAASASDAIMPVIAAVALVAVLGYVLFRRGRGVR